VTVTLLCADTVTSRVRVIWDVTETLEAELTCAVRDLLPTVLTDRLLFAAISDARWIVLVAVAETLLDVRTLTDLLTTPATVAVTEAPLEADTLAVLLTVRVAVTEAPLEADTLAVLLTVRVEVAVRLLDDETLDDLLTVRVAEDVTVDNATTDTERVSELPAASGVAPSGVDASGSKPSILGQRQVNVTNGERKSVAVGNGCRCDCVPSQEITTSRSIKDTNSYNITGVG